MSERPPEDEPLGEFTCARDEALFTMSMEAWACESSGATFTPLGYFAWMSNSESELGEIASVFSEEFGRIGVDTSELIGNFLIRQNSERVVSVQTFETENEARQAYSKLEAEHGRWLGDEG